VSADHKLIAKALDMSSAPRIMHLSEFAGRG
jgi:hypothetical protein